MDKNGLKFPFLCCFMLNSMALGHYGQKMSLLGQKNRSGNADADILCFLFLKLWFENWKKHL